MTGITSPQEKEEQKSPIVKSGLPFFFVEWSRSFCCGFGFPTSATTPSCCIKPRASQLTQPSTILPFVKLAMLIPEMVNCFPVGAIPLRSTFMRTLAGPTGRDCLAFGNDVLDRQSYVGECSAVEIRSLFFARGTSPKFGRRRVMVRVVLCKELVCYRQIALVPNFFE